jgi:hypothetical protein
MLVSLILALAGCATAYKPDGLTGGFSEAQLDTNVFRVYFRGNGYTRPERAEEFALLRSAELTLKNGFTHFVIIDSQLREKRGAYTTPTQSNTVVKATTYGNSVYGTASTTAYGGETSIISSNPRIINTIMCFKGKPDIQGLIYDAQLLCDSLGNKYKTVCGAN